MRPDAPANVVSWREYYYSIRIKLFVAFGLWAVLTAILSTMVLGLPLNHPARIGQATMLAVSIAGIASKHPRVHATLALTVLVAGVFFGLSIFLSSDAIKGATAIPTSGFTKQ